LNSFEKVRPHYSPGPHLARSNYGGPATWAGSPSPKQGRAPHGAGWWRHLPDSQRLASGEGSGRVQREAQGREERFGGSGGEWLTEIGLMMVSVVDQWGTSVRGADHGSPASMKGLASITELGRTVGGVGGARPRSEEAGTSGCPG
jgi:hypothetical protein